ncbi:SDR family NAD(P)-dependent oxidoreductase [Sphingomonas sp. HT-1]|uniref:SDR family NAD(P)-dependent oxidoreductase n=1 Tax=unclassified Sphingomonas TaxID=196159 RepID=UPI00035F5304|nr:MULTISPECIES: SDR family NAD(P)-dependent oxidoreductase [unclassified Sphingomonas]KTF67296.1 C-factor [Sphingomonas sp. WG]
MGLRAAVLGASGGIGAALVAQLATDPAIERVYAGSRRGGTAGGPVQPFRFDLRDAGSIAAAATQIGKEGAVDLVFVATGMLHRAGGPAPEKSFRAIDGAAMAELFQVNAIGPAVIARHFLPLLARDRRAVFAALSARVGSIADNRLGGWHSYRASKAALNMLIANFAIELRRTHPQAIVAALHPGTVDTGLSAPFQRGVPVARLFSPETSARHLRKVLDALRPEDSGGLFAWDGERLPY